MNKFQSHAGSIEADDAGVFDPQQDEFQSHAGSIEARIGLLSGTRPIRVSIPRWFD